MIFNFSLSQVWETFQILKREILFTLVQTGVENVEQICPVFSEIFHRFLSLQRQDILDVYDPA